MPRNAPTQHDHHDPADVLGGVNFHLSHPEHQPCPTPFVDATGSARVVAEARFWNRLLAIAIAA